MNSLSMGKYRPAIILILALTVFLASCKGTSDDPKSWMVRTFAGRVVDGVGESGTADTVVADGETEAVVAQFNGPKGVIVVGDDLYVADTANHTIRKITAAGVVTTIAGTAGTLGSTNNAAGASATFNLPQGVAVDSSGNIYVADTAGHLIRKIASTGTREVSTLAGSGAQGALNLVGVLATFSSPSGVAVDSDDNVIVADTGNNLIRKITIAADGTATASTLAGSGTPGALNLVGVLAEFNAPKGVAVDSDDNVYVVDTGNSTIRKITITTTTSDGVETETATVSTFAGTAGTTGTDDGTGATARFNAPEGVAVDSSGNVYVADTANHIIRKIELK